MFEQKTDYPSIFIFIISWYFWYVFYMYLNEWMYMDHIGRVNFFIHELGHVVFSIWGNELLSVMWWTLLQVILPVCLLISFVFQRDSFAVSFCIAIIGINFFYISLYSWDAQNLILPLISMWEWGDIIHDWRYIFSYFWILEYTSVISSFFKSIAIFCFIIYFFNTSVMMFHKIRK